MLNKFGPKVTAAFFSATMALSLALSSGAVHAQPNGNGYKGDPCYINGMGPFPDGTIHFFNGVTQICKDGEWVTYVRELSPPEPASPVKPGMQHQVGTLSMEES